CLFLQCAGAGPDLQAKWPAGSACRGESVMSTTQTSTIDFGHSLRDAVIAGVLSMLVFSPITNFVLKQYSFTLDWFRSPFFLNGVVIGLIVAFVRFFVSVGAQTRIGQDFIQNFIKTEHGVEVEDEYADGGKRLTRVLLW